MSKHLLIAGHGMQRNGRFDPGATGIIRKGEHKYMVEDLFPAMRKFLPKNHNVVFFTKHKVSNHGDLLRLAKQYNATEVTEFHYDAATQAARKGHVIVHSNKTPDNMDVALRNAIRNMLGVRYSHKGYSGMSGRSNLYNVNLAHRNGLNYRLLELGFGTNPQDANIMVNQVDEYAKELVKAITGEVSESPTVAEKVESKPSTNKVESIVDYLISKGRPYSFGARSDLAKLHGINNYRGTASQNVELLNAVKSADNKPQAVKNDYVGRRLESKINNLRFYNKPSWSDANLVGRVNKGIGFPTIVRKLKVGKGEQYEVKNSKGASYYITASDKYVSVVGGSSNPTPQLTVSQMADKIVNDKNTPNGHEARRKWLGIDNATYQKVRAEVNKRFR